MRRCDFFFATVVAPLLLTWVTDRDPDPKARGPPETLHEGQIKGGGWDGGEPVWSPQAGRHMARRNLSGSRRSKSGEMCAAGLRHPSQRLLM